MTPSKTNQSGFGTVEAILVLIIIGIIGFVGWYVLHAKQSVDNNLATNTSTVLNKTKTGSTATKPVDAYAGWKSFCTQYGDKICMKYPQDWILKRDVIANDSGAPFESDNLTAADGGNLQYYTARVGGSGASVKVHVMSSSLTNSSEYRVLGLVEESTDGTNPQYVAHYVVVPLSTTEASIFDADTQTDLGKKPYTPGTVFNSPYQPTIYKFATNGGVLVSESHNFTNLTAAKAWFNSSDTKTTMKIISSVKSN